MEISKKNLLKLIKENIEEMAMEFDPEFPGRPDPGIERALQRKETPLKKVPLPSTGRENMNFQELLASERYKQVLNNLRQYTGLNPNIRGVQNMGPLTQMMMSAHHNVVQMESQHREELERLAVDLVKEQMGIPEDAIEFDAKIVGMGEIDTDDFKTEGNRQQENPEEAKIEIEMELLNDLEKLNLEKAKRRLINSIVQGASKRGHYMYHLVSDKIREITGSEQLINLYGVLMSTNDINYWQWSDEAIKGAGTGAVAGKESVERPEDEDGKAKVIARGINFPVLVHELIKGVLELLAIQGRPEGEDFDEVEGSEDTLEKEMWDLRLGPPIWDRIRNQFPERVLNDENKRELQNYILVNLFKLPAKEFLVFMKEVISGSESGKRLMDEFVTGVEQMLNNEEYESAVEQFKDDLDNESDNTDDDDLYGFLDGLGIDRPTDN